MRLEHKRQDIQQGTDRIEIEKRTRSGKEETLYLLEALLKHNWRCTKVVS